MLQAQVLHRTIHTGPHTISHLMGLRMATGPYLVSEYPCIRDKPAGGGARERTTTSKHQYSDAFSQTAARETLPLRVGHAKRTTSRGSVPPLPWETQLSSRTARRVSLSPNITLQRESGKRHTAIDPLHTFPVHTNFGETVLLSHSRQELVPVQKRHVYLCTKTHIT